MITADRKVQNVWFVTGAGSGIGAGVAKAAIQARHRVVATGRNTDPVAQAVGDEVAALQAQIDAYRDLSASLALDELQPAGSRR